MNLKKTIFNRQVAGEIAKNIGLGIFVNALYGISSGTLTLFNYIDTGLGLILMISGIILERS